MRKFIAIPVFILGTMLLSSGYAELIAQGKKGSEKSAGKGAIEIIESKDGKYRFGIRDGAGKYLAGSPKGYETDKEAREAVEELKKVLATATYVKKKSEGLDK